MSYRTFRRILGETNLERKCRWLLGVGTLVLMMTSFIVFVRLTEGLANDQPKYTGRAVVGPAVARHHIPPNPDLTTSLDDLHRRNRDDFAEHLTGYAYAVLPPSGDGDPDDQPTLQELADNPGLNDKLQWRPGQSVAVYYARVRAEAACVDCHRQADRLAGFLGGGPPAIARAATLARPDLQEGDTLGVVRVRMSSAAIDEGIDTNRAWLIAFAVGTTILILAGTYLIIRYVVVKPVKVLKGTADAIAAGDLGVRSDLHTGDEFEDLSRAFNRMLANLIRTQEHNRGLIGELDGKVDELARINLELHRTNAVKTEFLSTVSHELRTPLNSIIGFSETLLAADNLTEKQHRWVANIHDNGKRLLALINDVLDLAKVESGRMRARAGVVAVSPLCEELGSLFRQQAEKKEIELVVQVPPDTPDVRQDGNKLRQIVTNLLSNAVKFTPEGGRVTLRAAVENEQLVIQVADTGVGIAPEHQEMVFQKFRQTSGSLTREQGGSGLGLSIVRELARLLGGDVELKSNLGRGSTFTVRVAARLTEDPLAAFSAE
ncbi:MAG: ATP-binding protein [Fimbriiglobus sp.]|nr:ATP-binding protein [Fimbriiglobus sp.]